MRKGGHKGRAALQRYKRGKLGEFIPQGPERDSTAKDIMLESSRQLLWEGGGFLTIPKTRKDWYQFTLDNFPIPIPEYKVCADHDTPLDFFIQDVTGTLEKFINLIMCSRESFKTYTLAMAMVTKCMIIPEWERIHLGAIKQQANKAYNYAKVFWKQFPYTNKFLDPNADILAEITYLNNGSHYSIGALTEAFANSERAGDVVVDEVDSVEESLRPVLVEDLINVPSTKCGITPALIMVSSVRRETGTMTYLLEDEECVPKWEEKGICKIWHWCFKETTERCVNYEFRCEDYLEKQMLLKILQERQKGINFKEEEALDKVQEWIFKAKFHCPIIESCFGDLHKAPKPVKPGALRPLWGKGSVTDMAKALPDKARRAQMDCIIPTAEGDLYEPEYVKAAGVHNLEFDPNPGFENRLVVDWGGTDPTVCHLIQKRDDDLDTVVRTWTWVKYNPTLKADAIQNIFYTYGCSIIKADSENADMNRELEDRGLPIKRIAFGTPSSEKGKSKLFYAVGIVEKRLESELLKISEENCAKLLRTMRKARNKPKGQHPFAITDDHHLCSLLCEYTDEQGKDYNKPLHVRQSMMENLEGKKSDQPSPSAKADGNDDVILISPGDLDMERKP